MTLKKARLVSLQRALPAALDRAAKETVEQGLQVRNDLVPVDTGELLESGGVLAGATLGTWTLREGAGLPDARARYTEFGTDKQAAQPHMTPAAEAMRKALPGNVAKQVKGLMK